MKPAILEGGVLTIAREGIEELAKRKGFNLQLALSPAGIVAAVTVPTGIVNVPAKVTLDRIRVEEMRIVGDGLAIEATIFPIPLSLVASYVNKYKFLALDSKEKKIYIDLNQLIPGYISLNIKEINIVDDAIQVLLGDIALENIPDI
jgi:hypothetical protein